MEDDGPLDVDVRGVLDELRKSEPGRQLVENLLPRFKEIQEKYQTLTDGDKVAFKEEFKKKFFETMLKLKQKFDDASNQSPSSPPPNSLLQPSFSVFFVAVVIIVGILG